MKEKITGNNKTGVILPCQQYIGRRLKFGNLGMQEIITLHLLVGSSYDASFCNEFLYSVGVKPVKFLNTVKKDDLLLKPHS